MTFRIIWHRQFVRHSRGLLENQSLEPLIVVLTSGSEPELKEVCRRERPPDPWFRLVRAPTPRADYVAKEPVAAAVWSLQTVYDLIAIDTRFRDAVRHTELIGDGDCRIRLVGLAPVLLEGFWERLAFSDHVRIGNANSSIFMRRLVQ